jgi:hypothetical protein
MQSRIAMKTNARLSNIGMACEVLEEVSPLQIDLGFEDREGFRYEKHKDHFSVGYSRWRLRWRHFSYVGSKLASYSCFKSHLGGADLRYTLGFRRV